MPKARTAWQREFLQSHQLDAKYFAIAQKWFSPVVANLAAQQATISRPILLAVNGSQGSGKSTLGDYLVASLKFEHRLSAVTLSLDDFYYSRAERLQLSREVHPLLATRGVPGTHDMPLLNRTLDALLASLRSPDRSAAVNIPRFDKATDDRLPESGWESISGPLDIVILEGWCLGVRPQSAQQLALAVNDLEESEDAQGEWRSYVNDRIRNQLLPLYRRVDQWLMLQAPSFDCVFRWRLEQEQKLAANSPREACSQIMNEEEVHSFIQYYQRLTEQCLLDLPARVHYLYRLDEDRNIINVECRERLV